MGGVLTVVKFDCCTEEMLAFLDDSTGTVSGAMKQTQYTDIVPVSLSLFTTTSSSGIHEQMSYRRICLLTRYLLPPSLSHVVLVSPPDTTIFQQDTIRHWADSSHNGSWQPLLSWPKVSQVDCLILVETFRSSSMTMIGHNV